MQKSYDRKPPDRLFATLAVTWSQSQGWGKLGLPRSRLFPEATRAFLFYHGNCSAANPGSAPFPLPIFMPRGSNSRTVSDTTARLGSNAHAHAHRVVQCALKSWRMSSPAKPGVASHRVACGLSVAEKSSHEHRIQRFIRHSPSSHSWPRAVERTGVPSIPCWSSVSCCSSLPCWWWIPRYGRERNASPQQFSRA